MRPIVALSLPITLSYPGKPVACSEITPKPTEWWLRPVMSAARVGEQSAVEWKLVYRRPLFAIRSSAGVGITPPNVLGTPYPASSVMIRSTFGAPFGGTMRAGQYGSEPFVVRSILPPNFCGGGGSCSPLIDIVAAGEPGGGLPCWADTVVAAVIPSTVTNPTRRRVFVRSTVSPPDVDRMRHCTTSSGRRSSCQLVPSWRGDHRPIGSVSSGGFPLPLANGSEKRMFSRLNVAFELRSSSAM